MSTLLAVMVGFICTQFAIYWQDPDSPRDWAKAGIKGLGLGVMVWLLLAWIFPSLKAEAATVAHDLTKQESWAALESWEDIRK